MKIKVTNSNTFTQINNYSCRFVSGVTEQDAAILLGMGKAYRKLKTRIQKEGLFSLGYAGYEECRSDQGFFILNRN
jgi:hypothetical protein